MSRRLTVLNTCLAYSLAPCGNNGKRRKPSCGKILSVPKADARHTRLGSSSGRPLAVAANVKYKLTGSERGIW